MTDASNFRHDGFFVLWSYVSLKIEVVECYGQRGENEVRIDVAKVLVRKIDTVMCRNVAPDNSGQVNNFRMPNIIEINRG